MKIIKAKVIGKKSFNVNNKNINIVNVSFASENTEGLDCANVFVDDISGYKVGQDVSIARVGKFVNIIEL